MSVFHLHCFNQYQRIAFVDSITDINKYIDHQTFRRSIDVAIACIIFALYRVIGRTSKVDDFVADINTHLVIPNCIVSRPCYAIDCIGQLVLIKSHVHQLNTFIIHRHLKACFCLTTKYLLGSAITAISICL